MLANGAKLGYSKTKPSGGSVSYTDLPGLKEIPEIGSEKEKVDTLILGAYGAGVFGQDATEVAQIFKRLLIEEFWTFENHLCDPRLLKE